MKPKQKLSKCIIISGKELLKELGIDFKEICIERADRANEIMEVNKNDKTQKSK